jgi:hypothetical protein
MLFSDEIPLGYILIKEKNKPRRRKIQQTMSPPLKSSKDESQTDSEAPAEQGGPRSWNSSKQN